MINGRTYYQLLQVDPSADTEVTGTSSRLGRPSAR